MTDPINLGERTNNGRMITPEQILEMCLKDIQEGKLDCNKLLIMPLNQQDGSYHFNLYSANLTMTEVLALLVRLEFYVNMKMNTLIK